MVSIKTLEHLDCNLPNDIAAALNRKQDDLQMLPAAATEALDMVKDPECTIASFAQVVERDVTLASDILSMANSILYSPGHPVVTLHEAVVYVGFRQCQNMIQSSCAASLMQQLSLDQESVRDALWGHSLTTAVVAAELNRRLELGFHGEEFTAGLLHDIGRLLLGALMQEQFSDFDAVDFKESNETPDRERQSIGTDHCVVGCSFVIGNRLPDELAESVRYHHAPHRATLAPALVAVIATADHMANHLCRQTSEPYDLAANDAVEAMSRYCDGNIRAQLTESHGAILAAAARNVAEMSNSPAAAC